MFKKISIIVLLLNMGMVNLAWSSDIHGWGSVRMSGRIIGTACAIDTNSIDQTIDMGTVPISKIGRDGAGRERTFTINLINCVLSKEDNDISKWQYFSITFDGDNDEGLFAVTGEAKGIAIKIFDNDGHVARPGTPLPLGKIDSGKMALDFSIQLVSTHKVLHAGDYNSIIKFKMDYY